ncbi:hypothetical protein PDIDSM_7271 [Penicillium digitatum]|nr:hypothetical protein PDIDSM_7271 [Penicillium digitatum]
MLSSRNVQKPEIESAASAPKVDSSIPSSTAFFTIVRRATIQKQPPYKPQVDTLADSLPVCCPGCGAFSQTVEANEPGYYGTSRKQIRKLLAVRKEAIEHINRPNNMLSTEVHDLSAEQSDAIEEAVPTQPIQDGAFPDEAVDPETNFLGSTGRITEEQRSRNRRSTNEKYERGRKLPSLSFIITRSDLLAATKEQVDSKMAYIRTELRAALGRSGREARLGNVHMISAHRGWWTKEVKEEIREHGGGIWVVGKANVGKSSFIEACFPKDSRNVEKIEEWVQRRRDEKEIPNQREATPLDPNSLLPPAPREDLYPVLPVVSSLPGTTVSPIRIPFGRGKGEVIDLPGLERGLLEDFVQDEHKRDLIMTKRIKPERLTIKPGQSLLLGGGLVRITPVNPQDTVMSASFLPLESHITNTQKAIETQAEETPYRGTVIMKEGTGSAMASAGKFDLKWDTTNSNLPTSLAKAVKDRGISVPSLPYRVMSADILIEGCGWIELSIQIRSKRDTEDEPSYPQVEVFTPNGKHIGSRRPIECWNFIAEKKKIDKRKRPRTRY